MFISRHFADVFRIPASKFISSRQVCGAGSYHLPCYHSRLSRAAPGQRPRCKLRVHSLSASTLLCRSRTVFLLYLHQGVV